MGGAKFEGLTVDQLERFRHQTRSQLSTRMGLYTPSSLVWSPFTPALAFVHTVHLERGPCVRRAIVTSIWTVRSITDALGLLRQPTETITTRIIIHTLLS